MKNKSQIDKDKIISEPPQFEAGLYLVSTPIGNLSDMTERAIAVMRQADLLACEDTRVTAKLCHVFGIATRRIRYDAHLASRLDAELVAQMAAGARIALVCDAGTPLISDPGLSLVQACLSAEIAVTPIPGASSVLAALVATGFVATPFSFLGFAERKNSDFARQISPWQSLPTTLILFEAPTRIGKTLARLLDILGDRPAVIGRELTKKFEEFHRGTLSQLVAQFAENMGELDDNDSEGEVSSIPSRGEMVLVIAPPDTNSPGAKAAKRALSEHNLDEALGQALAHLTQRDAIAQVAQELSLPKRVVYARALALANSNRTS